MTDWNAITTRIATQPPAVDFIENRLPSHIPAFRNHNMQYDRGSGRWMPRSGPPGITLSAPVDSTSNNPQPPLGARPKPPDDTSAMAFWESTFGNAMARFNKKFPTDTGNESFDIRSKRSWADIYAELDVARRNYLGHDHGNDGMRAKIRKKLRKAADNIQPVIEVTKFVPDIDYTTPILGAVKVLLEAAKVAADTRDQAVRGFDDLDQIFHEIELFLQTFPDDYKVRETAIDLIVSTFRAVELAIKFFTSTTTSRVTNAISYGDNYQKELRDSLSEMKVCSQQLVQDALGSHMIYTKQAMQKIINALELGALKKIHEALVEAQKGQCEVLNALNSLLTELTHNQEAFRRLEAKVDHIQSRTPSPAPLVVYFTTNEDLLGFINIPNFEEGDMQQIQEKKSRLNPEQQIQAENIVQNHRFKGWIVSTSCEMLLIHGDFREGSQRVSALSLFCTTLTAALRADRRFLPLVFFCGSHLEDDPCAGGLLMITSLVVQLLSQQDFDMRRFPHGLYEDLNQCGNIAALVSLFKWLLCQLPNDVTVFCLIDGAVYYERDQFIDGMSEVLAKILDMTMNGNLPVTVKVLVTSPTPTTLVRLPFEVKGSLLSVATMPSRRWGSSQLRLEREMGKELGDS